MKRYAIAITACALISLFGAVRADEAVEPQGSVTATLVFDSEGGEPQDAIEAEAIFSPATAAPGSVERPKTLSNEPEETRKTSCTITQKRLECALPSGVFDLCLRVPGYDRPCFWGLEIPVGGELSLGTIELARGIRLAGWLESTHRGIELAGTEIQLISHVEDVPDAPTDTRRRKLAIRRTESAENGHFEFTGLRPGDYRLEAVRDGFYSESQQVRITPETTEALAPEPLVLVAPAKLELAFEPPLDPWSEGWRVSLRRPTESANRWLEVSQGVADLTGTWTTEGLEPGDYAVVVEDSKKGQWYQEDLTLAGAESSRFIVIDVVPVEGRLSLGGEGLAAKIVFGTTQGPIQIPMISDEEGRFEGSLPREGMWPVELLHEDEQRGGHELEPVAVYLKEGRSTVRLDLELPDTRLQGRVVRDGEGTQAFLYGRRDEPLELPGMPPSRRVVMMQTSKDGHFEILGISPGSFRLQAYDRMAASEWRDIELVEGREGPEITLELRRRRRVTGQVVGPAGPVAGARLLARPDASLGRYTATDIEGRFELVLDAEDRWIDFLVLPPSMGFDFQRVQVPVRAANGEIPPIVLEIPPGQGDLVIPSLEQEGSLVFADIAISLRSVLQSMLEAKRLSAHVSGGFVFRGAAPGTWSLCRGSTLSEDCFTAELISGGEARLFAEGTQDGMGPNDSAEAASSEAAGDKEL